MLENFLESDLIGLEQAFIKRLRMFNNLSQIEKIQLAAELDFFKELESAGLSNVVQKLSGEYGGIIREIATIKKVGISATSLLDLELLLEADTESLLRSAQSYASQFKSRLIRGFIAGEDTDDILNALGDIGLKNNQTIAAINTARDQFNAVAVGKLFEDEPETRFKLNGPNDIKTRCECRAVLTKQPKEGLTQDEINKGAWHKIAMANCPEYAKRFSEGKQLKYNLVNRGGYNCRHFVEIVE